MTLTLSQLSEWLVLNGYSKLDGVRSKRGGWHYKEFSGQHWKLSDYPEHGCRYLGITPAANPVEGDPDQASRYSDMSIQFRAEGDRITEGYVSECYSGHVIARLNRLPESADQLHALIETATGMFREWVVTLPAVDKEEVAKWFRNKEVLDFFCSAEPEED